MSQAIASHDDSFVTSLQSIVGGDYVLSGEAADAYAVDEVVPRAVVFPASETEVARVMSFAHEVGLSVFPRGGGTQMTLGNIPKKVDIVLGLERLNRVVVHEPADMTVTVEAGITLEDLQNSLSRSGQFLPVDPPLDPDTTIGGILATRAFGPLRFGFRTIADSLLGIKVVTAQGQTAKAGGRVVKNVSGYELGRLYTGSMGTLAVIVEATFKVHPLPRDRAIIVMPCADMTVAQRYVTAIIECGVEPVLFELIASVGEQPSLAVGFTGTDEQVSWQVERAQQTLQHLPTPPASVSAKEWDDAYADLLQAHRGPGDHVITGRVHMRDTELYAYLGHILNENTPIKISIAAHAGSGVARIHLQGQEGTPESDCADHQDVLHTLTSLRERAEKVGGRLIIEKAPPSIKKAIDVWGPPGADFFLHEAVKKKMDPNHLLNPGRFIGGI